MPIHNFSFHQISFTPVGLQTNGPVLPVQVLLPRVLEQLFQQQKKPVPQPVSGFALIDTGASKSCVDAGVIKTLGVNPIGQIQGLTAAGPTQHPVYPARFRFPQQKFEIDFSSVLGVNLSRYTVMRQRIIVLLGRDVLAKCLFVYNGPVSSFILAL